MKNLILNLFENGKSLQKVMVTCRIILILAFIGIIVNTAKAQIYDPHDVEVINNLIKNNGLNLSPDDPESWNIEMVEWTEELPKKITALDISYNRLRGDASLAGLTKMTYLGCDVNDLTKLDLTNCSSLNYVRCSENKLTKLDLTNCSSLLSIFCVDNYLIEINVTGVGHLITIDSHQTLEFTLYKNKDGKYYSHPISLNEPTFYDINGNLSPDAISTSISYKNRVLESSDNTVDWVWTKIKPIGMEGDCPYLQGSPIYMCYLTSFMYFIYSDGESIDEADKEELKIYINHDKLFIECDTSAPLGNQLIVKLYDMLGKEILTHSATMNSNPIEININHLARGSYIVNVFSETKIIGNTKIVK